MIGNQTYAYAILDRLVHELHRPQLTGDSLRKRTAATASEEAARAPSTRWVHSTARPARCALWAHAGHLAVDYLDERARYPACCSNTHSP